MKLIRISTEKQQLEIKQRLIRFFGFLLVLGCIFGFLLLMMQYQIVCKQKQYNQANECILKRSIYNFYHGTTILGELREARVEPSHGSKGGTLFSLYLYTDHGSINLSAGSSSGQHDKEIAANAINTYIKTSIKKSFNIPYPANRLFIFLDAIFFIVGLLLLSIKDAIIVFDKTLQTVTIRHKGLWGQIEEIKFPLTDVDKVILEEMQGSKGSIVYRLALAFKDKPPYPLIATYDSAYFNKEKIANQLNEFIHSESPHPQGWVVDKV